ncbi:MAG TPA: hypothetical protein VEK08_00060 [Planctomycetota bacterium]|nr:hypothetical protein [Planctomycetota bacterium]
MDPIFGSTFRRQSQPRPLWLQVVLWCVALLFIAWAIWWIHYSAQWVWTSYRNLPPARRVLTGRLAALTAGLVALSTFVQTWRMAYYLDPPMRDLVTTPGSHWKILFLGLRARWNWIGVLYTAIFLYPFFGPDWLLALPVSYWGMRIPLSVVSAAGWSCLVLVLLHVLAIAIALVAAAIGVGGAAPRFSVPASLKPFAAAVRTAPLFLLAAALTVLIIRDPGVALASSSWWRIGEAIVGALEAPDSIARTLFLNFPSVCWFDAMRFAVPGPADAFLAPLLTCVMWIIAGMATIALACRAGLSMSVRATWHLDSEAAKPADALPRRKRRHDPDQINGPLEGWLVARIGRMGRAVLRLISAVYDVGAIDCHIRSSLLLLPLCIAGGYLSMMLLPDLVNAGMSLVQAPLNPDARNYVRVIAATVWIAGLLLYRMTIWGGMRFQAQQNAKTPVPADWAGNMANSVNLNMSLLMVGDSSMPSTRGDNRYPLTEIYPVGYSDAVLLPTLYALLWVSFVGILALAEAFLLGLDMNVSIWCVAIGIPAMVELSFLAAIGTLISNWMDYRRSRLVSFVKNVASGLVVALLLGGMFVLITLLTKDLLARERPWVAWLGALNMILIFDVAAYMTARWIYVRRPFDAERRNVKGGAG